MGAEVTTSGLEGVARREATPGLGRLWSLRWSWGIGAAAALGLVLFYLGLTSLAQGWEHARSLLWQDRYFVGALAPGFGVQWGLFVYLRRRQAALKSSAAVAGASTGVSTVSMVACCLHHASEVLPLLGISSATLFLAQYRSWFLALAIAMNLAGMAWMVRQIRRSRAPQCH